MNKFKYLIFHADMYIEGTDSEEEAENFALCEDFLVITTETQLHFYIDDAGNKVFKAIKSTLEIE